MQRACNVTNNLIKSNKIVTKISLKKVLCIAANAFWCSKRQIFFWLATARKAPFWRDHPQICPPLAFNRSGMKNAEFPIPNPQLPTKTDWVSLFDAYSVEFYMLYVCCMSTCMNTHGIKLSNCTQFIIVTVFLLLGLFLSLVTTCTCTYPGG